MASKSNPKSVHKGEVDLNWVLKYLKDGVYPTGLNFSEKRMVRKRAERFCYLNGDLHYLGTPTDQELGKTSRKVLLTQAERWQKVQELHVGPDGNHYGLERTADGITSDYHWVGIYKFIKEFIRQCATCREKHPYMLSVTQSTSQSQDVAEVLDATLDEDSLETVKSTGGWGGVQSENGLFWEKVDLRLFGPYKAGESSRYILEFVDCHTKWCEAFVIDSISPSTVAQSILQVICRFGVMAGLLMSRDDEVLEDCLVRGLDLLDTESDILIPFFMEERNPATDSLYKELEAVTEKFVKKHPNNWHQFYEFCLLPFRVSRHKKSANTPSFLTNYREFILPDSLTNKKGGNSDLHLTYSEKMKSTDTLMSFQLAVSGEPTKPAANVTRKNDGTFTPPQQAAKSSSESDIGQAVYVTRSRTGNTKPKTLDEGSFEINSPKRRSSVTALETPSRKRVRVESVHSTQTVDTLSDTESEDFTREIKDKKAVDLDTYYKAIEMYAQGNRYPDNSSNSFKRLIRDQAKNYSIRDGHLYHEVGNKGAWKKIIATREERVKLLTDIYQRTNNKTQMFAELENVHWKGKLIDCEAFVLASPHCDRYEQKPYKDASLRHLSEAKKLLKYDTMDTYNEIKNYLIYDVFSNDEIAQRLDEIKRQLKFFKVENNELIYVIGTKKRKVLTSSSDRQKAVQESHLRKGTHADLTTSFNQLCDQAFWFGMKLDVKIFINYCCTTTQDNKHLIDRYFIFREHHMKNYVPRESDSVEDDNMDTDVTTESDTHTTEVVKNLGEQESPVKSGIFVSSLMDTQKDLEKAMPNLAATLAAVETSLAANAGSSSLTASSPSIGTETVTSSLISDHTEMAIMEKDTSQPDMTEETVLTEETVITDESHSEPGAIIFKLSEDGQTVLVTKSVVDKPSDDITVAAVKSILPGVADSIAQDGENGQSTSTSELEMKDIETTASNNQSESVIEDQDNKVFPLDMMGDDVEDSDDMLYDTDEDEEEEEYFEEELGEAEGLSQEGDTSDPNTPTREKKPVTPRQNFKCSQCNKLFYGPIKFKMHMYKHTGHKPFPCNQCNKKYTNKKSLVIHQRTHSGDLPYLCTLCGKRTPSKIALKSHLKCHDGKGGGFPAKCDVCDREFTRKHLMERHKLHKHTNAQEDFKCGECNKMFGHQRSLKRHFMAAHMGVKNHSCTLCGKSFYRKEYLTGHLLQHGGTAAEGITKRPRTSTFKPRPSVFAQSFQEKTDKVEENVVNTDQVQRIILHQDENGQLRVVDLETEREVKRMLDSQINSGDVAETMVVHIEEPSSGRPQVVHVEQTEDQVVEVPIEGQSGVEYQIIQERPQEYVISADSASSSNTQYIYATSGGEIIQGNQDLVYGQPAVQYEVECVGDVGDEEALSAINLLAQASAQQYETVISQI